MGNIETKTKFSRLKSISNIENNYLEAATGSVLQKKAFLKNFAVCWFKFIEETPHRCFPVHIANFYLF